MVDIMFEGGKKEFMKVVGNLEIRIQDNTPMISIRKILKRVNEKAGKSIINSLKRRND